MAEPQSCHLAFPGVPAIHRGQYPLWESNLGWGSAHGELQELLKFYLFHKIQCLFHPPFKIHYHRRLIATMPGIIIN